MGGRNEAGYNLQEFQALYQADPFYNWFGLDNPLMYAAHKAAGGMTSIYRQIGIGCEALFRRILQDTLGLSETDTKWSYQLSIGDNKNRTLSLDGRIILDSVDNLEARERIRAWIEQKAFELQYDPGIVAALRGEVFEVRQGCHPECCVRPTASKQAELFYRTRWLSAERNLASTPCLREKQVSL